MDGPAYRSRVGCVAELYAHRVLGIPDSDRPLDPELATTTMGPGRVRETWRVTGHAGDRVPVDVVVPDDDVAVVVVAAHGFTGWRRSPYLTGAAKGWAVHGLAVVAPDLPFHGDRAAEGVDPSAIHAVDAVLRSLGDLTRIVDLVAGHDRLGGRPIGVLGFSMGGWLGTLFAAGDHRVGGLCLCVAGSNARRVRFAGPPLTADQEATLLATDPATYAPAVGDRPVLMLNADRDEVFDRIAALDLYDAFEPPKALTFFPGTHAEWPRPAPVYRMMRDFLAELA